MYPFIHTLYLALITDTSDCSDLNNLYTDRQLDSFVKRLPTNESNNPRLQYKGSGFEARRQLSAAMNKNGFDELTASGMTKHSNIQLG